MKQRFIAIASVLMLLVGFVPFAAAADSANVPVNFRGGLPLSSNYHAVKAALDAQAPQQTADVATVTGTAPTTVVKFKGVQQNNVSPSDATGAMGPTEYIELVNEQIGVYNRSGVQTSTASEATFTGFGSNASGDGVILYDIRDGRFYYAMLWISGTTYELGYGFSKTSSPSANATDWCSYNSTFGSNGYGSDFPDYPKLGQTDDFILIGVNRFDPSLTTFLGGDVAWSTKPAPGTITTCPSSTSFTNGVQKGILNADGSAASTPQPARQTDAGGTGYVVANHDVSSGGSANYLSIFTVTTNGVTGLPNFSNATTVNVTSYSMPPSAPQKSTSFKLDTLDGRLMNAWVAPDPNQGGALGLWTQHTVAASTGGLGAEVRWYEIDPTTGALFQNGIAHTASMYVFDGAIAPDRNGTTGQFGGNMVLGVNASSSTQFAMALMVSKIGANPQSGFSLVLKSTKADKDFTCSTSVPCRWGDYAGASPDPDPAATSGHVWFSIQLSNGGSFASAGWMTENWEANP